MKTASAIDLLKRLISCPSISREEAGTADILQAELQARGCEGVKRFHNNIYLHARNWNESKPTLLLCSHHDTVRPASGYTNDPFTPITDGDRLFGLGSNDAGASVVCLLESFCALQDEELAVNLVLALVGEEEISGANGVSALLPELCRIDMAIVGEPTKIQAAVGERGLVVVDGETHGVSGHAARGEGVNALYLAMDDIQKLRDFQFPKRSALLGDISVTVTGIQAGIQHNVVPDLCKFYVDVRTTDAYSNEDTVKMLQEAMSHTTLTPRNLLHRASAIDLTHPLVKAAEAIGASTYVSPTMSDMASLPMPSLKIGPGDSARSHTADEYILFSEIEEGIKGYTDLLRHITID